MSNVSIKYLDWDSKFFNKNIIKIQADEITENLLNVIERPVTEKLDLAYIELPYPNDSNLESLDCHLYDVKETYEMDLETKSKLPNQYDKNIREIKYSSEPLYELALQAGHKSRYKLDPRFSNHDYERLYRVWIDNSFLGIMADKILGYYIENELVGFITIKFYEEFSDISLIAVGSECRSQGIGKKLIEAALITSKNYNFKYIRVVTQMKNEGASRFYKNMGFVLKSSLSIYHKWYKK